MGLDVTAIIFGGFGAISNMVKGYKRAETENRTLSPDEVNMLDNISGDLELEYYGKLDAVGNCIDWTTLEALWTNIDSAQSTLRGALANPKATKDQKDQAIEAASATVCAELSRIRRLNRGILPHSDLQKISDSFGCNSEE
jgi:hypothetical protein